MGAKKSVKINAEKKMDDAPPAKGPEESRPGAAENPLAALEAELEAKTKEAQENYDRLLRASAELENFKKRSARETAEFRKYANESIIKAIIPVIDNLERALESSKENQNAESSIIEGVRMTLSEILKVFESFNVRPIESLGKTFDPGFHQAVMQQKTDDHPDNTVLEELQKGYLMHDRLIRPAMVIVSKKETPDSQEKAGQPKDNQKD